jgi:hypothetical protein
VGVTHVFFASLMNSTWYCQKRSLPSMTLHYHISCACLYKIFLFIKIRKKRKDLKRKRKKVIVTAFILRYRITVVYYPSTLSFCIVTKDLSYSVSLLYCLFFIKGTTIAKYKYPPTNHFIISIVS